MLGIVPRWSPHENQRGVGWRMDEIGGSSYSRTGLKGITDCEDDVVRKESSPRRSSSSRVVFQSG